MTGGRPRCSRSGMMDMLRAAAAFFFLSALSAGGPRFYLTLQTAWGGGNPGLRLAVMFS